TKTPFEVDSLTEDYELGMRIRSLGGQSRFLRMRGEDGTLIATRACFPARIDHAVRQKARWMHGIAFQGWDRLGWTGGTGEYWMRLRDRRGPLTALVLFAGYLLLVIGGTMFAAEALGYLRLGTHPRCSRLWSPPIWQPSCGVPRCGLPSRHANMAGPKGCGQWPGYRSRT